MTIKDIIGANGAAQEEEVAMLDAIYPELEHTHTGRVRLPLFNKESLGSECETSEDEQSLLQNIFVSFTLPDSYPSDTPPSMKVEGPDAKNFQPLLDDYLKEKYTRGQPCLFEVLEYCRDEIATQWRESLETERRLLIKIRPENQELVFIEKIKYFRGDPVTDRKSKFQATLFLIEKVSDVETSMRQLYSEKKYAEATHNIIAWRLEDENGVIHADQDDDGESGASERLMRLLLYGDVKGVLICVSRWFGGVHLGPDRFKHISNVAKELLQQKGYLSTKN